MFEGIKAAIGRIMGFRGRQSSPAPAPAKVTTLTKVVAPLPTSPRRGLAKWAGRQLPASSFTKKGPGITVALRRVLAGMDKRSRLACRSRGWDRGMVRPDGRLK